MCLKPTSLGRIGLFANYLDTVQARTLRIFPTHSEGSLKPPSAWDWLVDLKALGNSYVPCVPDVAVGIA